MSVMFYISKFDHWIHWITLVSPSDGETGGDADSYPIMTAHCTDQFVDTQRNSDSFDWQSWANGVITAATSATMTPAVAISTIAVYDISKFSYKVFEFVANEGKLFS